MSALSLSELRAAFGTARLSGPWEADNPGGDDQWAVAIALDALPVILAELLALRTFRDKALARHRSEIQDSCPQCQALSDDHFLETGSSRWFGCPGCIAKLPPECV